MASAEELTKQQQELKEKQTKLRTLSRMFLKLYAISQTDIFRIKKHFQKIMRVCLRMISFLLLLRQ